jgi:adenine deaminase
MNPKTIHTGRIVDPDACRIFHGAIEVRDGIITAIRETDGVGESPGLLCPGFVDAHVHIESSMLPPAEFGRIAVAHGTVATVSDPHEIANVLGAEGVRAMQRMAADTPLKIHFGVPSCVPATGFETAGAVIDAAAVGELLEDPSLTYLAEMMNFPGVVHADPEVMAKLDIARRLGKNIDGHAPGLRGDALRTYVAAGITTDHECVALDEAREKLGLGQKILIREGSAAKNFEALHPLLFDHPERCMFCSDDKHPDDLLEGHIDRLCARAVAAGVPAFHALRAACITPAVHYGLRSGRLRAGDTADFIRLADLESFRVMETWIDGTLVAENGRSLLPVTRAPRVNHFDCASKQSADFALPCDGPARIRVIEAIDGSLLTGAGEDTATVVDGHAIADPARDLLKITVVNRYKNAPPAVAFVRGVGLKRGAIASSVAHDCHNIVAVGCDDESLARAVNLVIAAKGGIALAADDGDDLLALPIAGLMSDERAEDVAAGYARLTRRAHALGSNLHAPYMTLSFLALLVIPSLKLSDLGLFDGGSFSFTAVFLPHPGA